MGKKITQSTVIKMGFTKTMIEKLLPEPILVDNPHYRNAAQMKLWDEDKVKETMETNEYKTAKIKADARRNNNAQKAVATKEKKTIEMMKKLSESIEVKLIDDRELVEKVLSEKREQIENKGHDFYSPDEETLNRWVVNYIRHDLTFYDRSLHELYGRVGKTEGYKAFKKAILEKISIVYPKYAEECKDQSENVDYYGY